MGKGIIAVAVIAILGFFGVKWMKGDDTAKTTDMKEDANPTDEKKTEKMSPSAETKTIRTVATYTSPAGEDKIAFVLGLDASGTIVSTLIESMTENEISKKLQGMFGEGFSGAIVGKKLSELSNIDRVGGASLTTGAFNQSLAALKSQM